MSWAHSAAVPEGSCSGQGLRKDRAPTAGLGVLWVGHGCGGGAGSAARQPMGGTAALQQPIAARGRLDGQGASVELLGGRWSTRRGSAGP